MQRLCRFVPVSCHVFGLFSICEESIFGFLVDHHYMTEKYSTHITLDVLQICCSAISKQFCFIFCPSAAFKFDLAKVAVEFEEFMIVHLLSDVAMDLASRTKQHLRIFFQAKPLV